MSRRPWASEPTFWRRGSRGGGGSVGAAQIWRLLAYHETSRTRHRLTWAQLTRIDQRSRRKFHFAHDRRLRSSSAIGKNCACAARSLEASQSAAAAAAERTTNGGGGNGGSGCDGDIQDDSFAAMSARARARLLARDRTSSHGEQASGQTRERQQQPPTIVSIINCAYRR